MTLVFRNCDKINQIVKLSGTGAGGVCGGVVTANTTVLQVIPTYLNLNNQCCFKFPKISTRPAQPLQCIGQNLDQTMNVVG